MLRELLLYPELRPRFSALSEYAVSPLTRALLEELTHSDDPVARVVGRHAEADKRLTRLAAVQPTTELEDAAEKAERTYVDVLRRMKVRHVDAARRDVLRELSETEARGEDTTELARRVQDLSRRKKALRDPAQRPERS
jgi:hypothetical protein